MMRHWGFLVMGLLTIALFRQTNSDATPSLQTAELTGVVPAADGPMTRVYIEAAAAGERQTLDMRRRFIAAGAAHVNLFLPYGILVCEVPASMDLRALIGDSRVSALDVSNIDAAHLARAGEGLQFVEQCYSNALRPRSPVPPTSGVDPGEFDDAVLTVPRDIVRESVERAEMAAAAGDAQERSIQQNAEFLAGDVLMQVILPESEGHGEDWSEDAIASALQGSFAAGIAYQQRFANVPMHFIFKAEEQVATGYEPIQTEMGDHTKWIGELMTNLGIPATVSPPLMVHEYNNLGRRYYQTDWAFTAFVASSENAVNHRFADQWYTAYAMLGGPYLVIPHPAGENPFEIDPVLLFSTVFQHEMGHVFWALDEYSGPYNDSQCTSRSGYLDYANMNKVTEFLDGTLAGCPGVEPVDCIMWKAKEDLGRPVCRYTQGQVGVIDNNRNDIPDVYDEAPTVEFEAALAETVNTPDVTVNMKVISVPVANRNPRQEIPNRMSYAPKLKSASLTVNGVGPVHLKPLDGKWDGLEEDLSLVLKGLPVGMTEIAVTARNMAGKSSKPIVKKIFFAGIKFALFDLDVREGGIYLSWNTVGETFGARLDLYRIDRSSGAPVTTVLVSDIQPKDEHNLYRFFEYFDTNVRRGYQYDYFVRGKFTIEYPDTAIEYQTDSGTFSARGMFPIPVGNLASRVSPNPFNESTNISVRIPESFRSVGAGAGTGEGQASSYTASVPAQTEITITVYDVAGRLVKQIYRGRHFGGVQTFKWDGTNAADRRVPSGIYFIKTVAGSATEVKKVVALR